MPALCQSRFPSSRALASPVHLFLESREFRVLGPKKPRHGGIPRNGCRKDSHFGVPMKLAIFTLFFALPCAAYTAGKSSVPKANDTVKATAPVKLRASSPDPSFGTKGDQIGWLKSGDLAIVLNVKSYISINGTEIWV